MLARSVLLPPLLLALAGSALAQTATTTPAPATTEPIATPGKAPDACRLLPQADLEALFPGRPITAKGPTLSPISRGPQYAESCMYSVKLPSPTSKLDHARFASVTVIRWDGVAKGRETPAQAFASIKTMREKVASDPKLTLKLESLSGVGDEAFQETTSSSVVVRTRKDDLIYSVSLDVYSEQTAPNALALAKQAAARWQGGTGMVDAPTQVAANSAVTVPADTRPSSVAPVDQWPDACALLTPAEVKAAFPEMRVSEPRKLMGKITHESRENRQEALPNPIGCQFDAKRTVEKDGKRTIELNQIQVSVRNVAATEELSKRWFLSAIKVSEAKTPVDGLGDEAALDIMNRIHIRKGLTTVDVRVSGGERDQALHDQAKARVGELAKIVAARLK
ncbi:conserved exported hypothetical protein [Bosea sp. 62]|uniref:hypothetical protein n=1 Tax=unclassified Bosea (in: a-proteobacteria) TaxID=2653178 RepID=UPI001259DBEA|nr:MULTISPECIES: hypothetical protein [unclassified Bosea (in: a-proteobacteria)]CAD5265756.1 conserved exported hypothetical protein [Bosea sp. 46]CAD5267706.1 conserved exported hypothetical protein [Bosea sp. 21B]CAD5271279.1 conserved exported hypothetical protein [Bosea sp. 7B]VVT55608.1 conserved exported hypothetical protein [Bosea sp. EC-HK365B]VXB87661.1 conserved exported hypothetical protein [Bosea sp. 29B]